MKSLLILGAGGYGQLVKELAQLLGYDRIDFLDDNSKLSVGKLDDISKVQDNYDAQIVAIGKADIREKYIKKIKNPVTLIHPSAIVSISSKIGSNVVIEPKSVVGPNSIIKNGSFICSGAVINHNAVVGKYCQIDCNAVVGSFSEVDKYTKVVSCSLWQNS
ncbi:PglD-related sugar-binding protein [Dorea sp.]